MSVTGKKGRDKSSIGCFRCQAHSVCVTGVYILTESVLVPSKLHDSLQRAGCYQTASKTDLYKDFSVKRAGRIHVVPKETFLGAEKELGWLPGWTGT